MNKEVYLSFKQFKQKNFDKGKKIYAVIGNPIGHSMSPLLHKNLNKNCEYVAVNVLPEELSDFCVAAASKINGFNVTVPYKKDIIKHLFQIDGANDLASVNTVLCEQGNLFGYNTDVYGITQALNSSGINTQGKNVLILGAGGAASAAAYAFNKSEAVITIAARDTVKAKRYFTQENVIDIKNVKGRYDIVVNCTPCGMKGRENETAINISDIQNCAFVYDVVYNPLITRLVKEAKASGIKAENGLSMLVNQAVMSQNIWGSNVTAKESIYNTLKAEIIRQRLSTRGKKCIALCGFMGSGKTAAAGYISRNYGLRHIDTDQEIEKASGLKISQIFSMYGEKHFRRIERDIIKHICYNETAVISLGGGAVVSDSNLKELRKHCVIVYIESPLNICLERAEKGTRPLLNANKDDICEVYQKRKTIYKNICDITVQGQNTPGETGDEIIYNI